MKISSCLHLPVVLLVASASASLRGTVRRAQADQAGLGLVASVQASQDIGSSAQRRTQAEQGAAEAVQAPPALNDTQILQFAQQASLAAELMHYAPFSFASGFGSVMNGDCLCVSLIGGVPGC